VSIKFSDLPIIPEIQSALKSLDYLSPTPIQAESIPPLLEGQDLLGCAQTGTGKTAAFAIPLLQKIQQLGKYATPYQPVGLIVAPTRELVVQIAENMSAIGKNIKFRQTTVFGGVGQRPQVTALAKGVHVVIATPGRLLDLIDQEYCSLSKLQYFVLDEADRMLDMGFMPDIQKIVRMLPKNRQSVFLSATMPAPIEKLASSLLHNHATVMVTPPSRTADLVDAGISAEGIHGGRSQNARQRVLNSFRDGEIRVLIATDVASRGIDIDEISHVINYDVPVEAEAYVHRIGRTARAGASGESITLCDGDELKYLREIEKTIGMAIPIDRDHPFHSVDAADDELNQYNNLTKSKKPRSAKRGRGSGSGATPGTSSRKKSPESTKDRTDDGAVTQRRRSISGKVRKIKPRSPSHVSGYMLACKVPSYKSKRAFILRSVFPIDVPIETRHEKTKYPWVTR